MRGEDERRGAKERGRGSKPRSALALGLRTVPSPFSPSQKRLTSCVLSDSSCRPLSSSTRCRQNAASGKIVERRANNGEKDWHETTSVLPKRGTNALGQKQHKQGDHHASHYVVQVHHVPSLHLFLPRVLTLQLDLLWPLVRCTCTEQYRSTLLLRTL